MLMTYSGKHLLIVVSPAAQIPIPIEKRIQDFIDEATKNGIPPNEALKGLLELGITAVTLRMLPAQTNRAIGRWK